MAPQEIKQQYCELLTEGIPLFSRSRTMNQKRRIGRSDNGNNNNGNNYKQSFRRSRYLMMGLVVVVSGLMTTYCGLKSLNRLFRDHHDDVHEGEIFLTHYMFQRKYAISTSKSNGAPSATSNDSTIKTSSKPVATTIPQQTIFALGIKLLSSSTDATTQNDGIDHQAAMVPGTIEYQWWLVRGQVVFVSSPCRSMKENNNITYYQYYSTRYRRLWNDAPTDPAAPFLECSSVWSNERPLLWDRMLSAAQHIASHHYRHHRSQLDEGGIVRLVMMANSKDVYITSSMMNHAIDVGTTATISSRTSTVASVATTTILPTSLQGLLHGSIDGHLPEALLEPYHVERITNDASTWVFSSYPKPSVPHPNAEKLCQSIQQHTSQRSSSSTSTTTTASTDSCVNNFMALEEDYPIRCVSPAPHKNGDAITDEWITIGQYRIPTFDTVITRVDWQWATGLLMVVIVLQVTGWGAESKHGLLTVVLYLMIMTFCKYMKPNNAGLFSAESLWATTVDSYVAFTVVHPTSSPLIAISHFGTYWFSVAAVRSKSIRGVLFWFFLYESITSFVNEYTHMTEEDNTVRCFRVSFIHDKKQYAVNDMIRAYVLPPFFVYLYLLPKMILSWWTQGLGS